MKTKLSTTVGALALAAVFALAPSIGASATARVTVHTPTGGAIGGSVANLPVALTGFTFANLNVDITIQDGTLTLDDQSSLATLNPGFSSLTDQSEISFHASAADATSLLASHLTWTTPTDASKRYNPLLTIDVSEYLDGQTFDPASGHTYKYVTSPLSWSAASTAAKALTFKGHSGYLANITSAAENTFVANKSGAANVWFGATDSPALVAAINTEASKPVYTAVSGTSQTNGHFIWGGGTEEGNIVSEGLANPVAPNGGYQAWADGEPNNAGSVEGCAVTNWQNVPGAWNDLNCTGTHAYLVEFDTSASDFSGQTVSFDNTASVPQVAGPALANTGADVSGSVSIALMLIVAGAGALVVVRKAQKA